MCIENTKIIEKNEKQLRQMIRICSPNIAMEFGFETCTMLRLRSGERESAEGIEIPTQESIKTLREKENFRYLIIVETDAIKQAEMKEKIRVT